jgi:hypothetical protein
MSKPYWSGQGGRTGSSYVDDVDFRTHRPGGYDSSAPSTGFYSSGGYRTTDEYRDTDYASHRGGRADFDDNFRSGNFHHDDDDDDVYEYYEGPDTRWRWVAALAVAVLLVAVLAITMLMRNDSTTPTAQTVAPATSTAPRTVVATVPPSTAPPQTQMSPETVVTITTTPSAAAVPPPLAAPLPTEAVPPPPATVDPRTVTYSVTGTRQLIDLVTIIYTDEQGLPRTDVNVSLPWNKTLVLDPGVDFESVTATSVTGQLNCAITDASGATLVAQNNNSMIATCTS